MPPQSGGYRPARCGYRFIDKPDTGPVHSDGRFDHRHADAVAHAVPGIAELALCAVVIRQSTAICQRAIYRIGPRMTLRCGRPVMGDVPHNDRHNRRDDGGVCTFE